MILLPRFGVLRAGGSPALLPFLASLHVAVSRLVSLSLRFATPPLWRKRKAIEPKSKLQLLTATQSQTYPATWSPGPIPN